MVLILEVESKEMFCPFTMSLSPHNHSSEVFRCCGHRCMAWQWEDKGDAGGQAVKGFCGMISTNGRNEIQPNQMYY